MIQLLFVEDDERAIRHARRKVEELHNDVECEVKSFQEAPGWIAENPPDIVSLDLVLDGLSGEAQIAGQPIYESIWDNHFCPIIIYSAQPEAEEDNRPAHPFLTTIKKGTGSPSQFSSAVDAFRPHIDALRTAEQQVRREFTIAMRDLAPSIFSQVDSPEERQRIVIRSGRRRVAAQMDDTRDLEGGDETSRLAAWEHYLCPPVDDGLLLGDILKAKGSESEEPTSYRVVLTPSCDLVATGGRSPKVPNVLVAKCIGIKEALESVNVVLGTNAKKNEDKLKPVLSQSYVRHILPFPRFANIVPTMAADFKQLELIPFDASEEQFDRVASLDSPFREVVAWAYMQTGGRPALPDRELEHWVAEIIDAVQADQSE